MFTTSSVTMLFFVSNAEAAETGGAQPRAGPSESQLDGPALRVSAGRSQAGRSARSAQKKRVYSPAGPADPAPPSGCLGDLFSEPRDLDCETSLCGELRVEEAREEPEPRDIERESREEATRGAFWREDDGYRVGGVEHLPCRRAEREVSGVLYHGHGEGRHRGVS